MMQEQASRKEIEELKWQLLSSEGLVADLQKEIQWRESQLQEIKAKITTQQLLFQWWNIWLKKYTHMYMPVIYWQGYRFA